jgi:hypothetical protein
MDLRSLRYKDLKRTLDLDPLDWNWAAWRSDYPHFPGEPQPFNLQESLDRLQKITTAHHGYRWNWSEARIRSALTPEEARFWLTAMRQAGSKHITTPKKLAAQMANASFSEDIPLSELQAGYLGAATQGEVIYPLINLYEPQDLLDWVLAQETQSTTGQQGISNGLSLDLLERFGPCVLPFLSPAQKEALIEQIIPEITPTVWPTDHYQFPPVAFFLGAGLGLQDALLPVIESWPDNLYGLTYGWINDYYHRPQLLVLGLRDPELVMFHMRRLKLKLYRATYIKAWLAHTEFAACNDLRDLLVNWNNKEEAAESIEILSRVRAPEAALPMLDLMLLSKAPQLARQWLQENPVEAIVGLMPTVVGRGRLAEAAQQFFQQMQRKGYGDLIQDCLEAATPEVAQRVRDLFATASFNLIPFEDQTTPDWLKQAIAQCPPKSFKAPDWVTPIDLSPIQVEQYCLNDAQVARVLAAFKKSDLNQPHALITDLKQEANRESLETFVWDLLQLWLALGAPSKEKWAMVAVGLWGGDRTALKLAPLVRAWPGESQHQRAVFGLDCLRTIGTDTALMQINGIAQKVKFKALKAKAQDCIAAIAQERHLTPAELEDRIVPDCGLNEQGTYIFDFGNREFRLVLGPDMKVMVRDSDKKLKPNLPKPNSKDDAEKSAQALADWKLIKKQIQEVVKIQTTRLEQALVTQRRWTLEAFEMLLVHHPLMINLIRLLVWAAYDAKGELMETFRITEDQAYANAADEDFDLQSLNVVTIGIVHPIHLSEALRSTWGELFSDYELVPPFPQLSRPIYRLEPEEDQQAKIVRFHGTQVSTYALMGTLARQGWQRGDAADSGVYCEHLKHFPTAGIVALLNHDGIAMGSPDALEDPLLFDCYFIPDTYLKRYWGCDQFIPLDQVDPLTFSEVVADIMEIDRKS